MANDKQHKPALRGLARDQADAANAAIKAFEVFQRFPIPPDVLRSFEQASRLLDDHPWLAALGASEEVGENLQGSREAARSGAVDHRPPRDVESTKAGATSAMNWDEDLTPNAQRIVKAFSGRPPGEALKQVALLRFAKIPESRHNKVLIADLVKGHVLARVGPRQGYRLSAWPIGTPERVKNPSRPQEQTPGPAPDRP